MKNKFLLLFITLCVFSACRKKYTCECYTTYTYLSQSNGFFTLVIPGSKTAYNEKMREKIAKSACQHEQTAIQTNFKNAITDEGRDPLKSGESISTSCDIK